MKTMEKQKHSAQPHQEKATVTLARVATASVSAQWPVW